MGLNKLFNAKRRCAMIMPMCDAPIGECSHDECRFGRRMHVLSLQCILRLSLSGVSRYSRYTFLGINLL